MKSCFKKRNVNLIRDCLRSSAYLELCGPWDAGEGDGEGQQRCACEAGQAVVYGLSGGALHPAWHAALAPCAGLNPAA